MGLCLSVGIMADLQQNDSEGYEVFQALFAKVNMALAKESLPSHDEPVDLPPENSVSFDMYGYSGLHYLRRIAAHLAFTGQVPSPGDENSSKDELLQRYYKESCDAPQVRRGLLRFFARLREASKFEFNHLIDHSDCEGFYLPIDFEPVIYPEPTLGIPGAMMGSSHRLLRECHRLSAALQIPTDVDPESEDLYSAAENQGQGTGWKKYGIESFTCIRLLRACEVSLRSGAALVFT